MHACLSVLSDVFFLCKSVGGALPAEDPSTGFALDTSTNEAILALFVTVAGFKAAPWLSGIPADATVLAAAGVTLPPTAKAAARPGR